MLCGSEGIFPAIRSRHGEFCMKCVAFNKIGVFSIRNEGIIRQIGFAYYSIVTVDFYYCTSRCRICQQAVNYVAVRRIHRGKKIDQGVIPAVFT